MSDVYGDFTYEDVYLRSWDLAKGILGLLGQVCHDFYWHKNHFASLFQNWLQKDPTHPSPYPDILNRISYGRCMYNKSESNIWMNDSEMCFRAAQVKGLHSCVLLVSPMSLLPGPAGWVDRFSSIFSSSERSSKSHHLIWDGILHVFLQVAVPLCPSSPVQRLHHQIADSTCSLVITTRCWS